MLRNLSGIAVTVGIALFLMAGYKMIQYRDMLKLTQQEYTTVPSIVLGELALACALCLWGSLKLAGSFKPISALSGQEGLDAFVYRPDFAAFNHRGHLLPLDLQAITDG